MTNIRRLFSQSSYYFTSNILVALAGMITLPIWTRLLSQEDYGLFSLFNITISFMVTFSKFGLQHSALRFFSDFKGRVNTLDLRSYFTTMLIGGICISGTVVLIIILVAIFFFSEPLGQKFLHLLPFIGAIILIQATNNLQLIFLRAEQQVKLYSIVYVARRYGQLTLAILFVFILGVNLHNIYLGWLVNGGIILMLLMVRLLFLGHLSMPHFSPAILKEAVIYGFPLIWFELSNEIMCLGDRYVIQYYMGSAAVGVYSAGYNTADLVQSLITFPIRLAIIPMFLSLWSSQGEGKTREFLSQALKYYFMFGIPLALGVSWFSKDIIMLLASAKYAESHVIVPYIVFPLIIYGAFGIYGAGLYIQKKTMLLMYSTLLAGGINIGLNFVLVPNMGILGAAISTLIAYIFLAVSIFVMSYRFLKVPVDLYAIGKYAILSFGSIYLVSFVGRNEPVTVKIAIVILLYGVSLLFFDKQLRVKALLLLSKSKA